MPRVSAGRPARRASCSRRFSDLILSQFQLSFLIETAPVGAGLEHDPPYLNAAGVGRSARSSRELLETFLRSDPSPLPALVPDRNGAGRRRIGARSSLPQCRGCRPVGPLVARAARDVSQIGSFPTPSSRS